MASASLRALRQRDLGRRQLAARPRLLPARAQRPRRSAAPRRRLLRASASVLAAVALSAAAVGMRGLGGSPAPAPAAQRRLGGAGAGTGASAGAPAASDLSALLDERFAFDGSHSDFAQQFLRLHLSLGRGAGSNATARALAPERAQVPAAVAAHVREAFSLAFEALPPLLQLAALWDGGYVAAAALGYVRVRTRCGLRMSDLALSREAYASAGCVAQACASPSGERFSQSLYCNGAQMAAVALCAATDGVAPVHAPMWSDGGADDTLPVAEMAKHEWRDGGAAYTVFAIHLAGDPNSYGKCSLPSVTVPCAVDDGSDDWCEPERGRLVAQWLAHEQRRQSGARAGEQHVQALGDGQGGRGGGWTRAASAVAAAATALALALAAAAALWWRARRQRARRRRGARAILGGDSWAGGSARHEAAFALDEPTARSSRSGARGRAPRSASPPPPLSLAAPATPPSSLRVASAGFYPSEDRLRPLSGVSASASISTSTSNLNPTSTSNSGVTSASASSAAPPPPLQPPPGAAALALADHAQSPLSSSSVVISSNPALDASVHAPPSPDSARARLPLDAHVLALRVAVEAVDPLRPLAVGAYGEVWLGRLRRELVAVKRLRRERRQRPRDLEAFAAEALLMARLSHPNVVSLRGVAWSALPALSLVMEFVPGGDLRRVLERQGGRLAWAMAKARIARDVARALAYLHARGVVHRDLKSKNVLVGEQLAAKLSDFGTSRYRSDKHSVRSLRIDFVDEDADGDAAMRRDDAAMTAGVGTAFWTAPEVLAGGRYAEKADVYSFGVVLSELDTCQLPFSDAESAAALATSMRPLQVLSLVLDGTLRPHFRPSCPDQVRQLAAACLRADADARPTAVEIVEALDAFVTGL